jgi:transmembrane sensor
MREDRVRALGARVEARWEGERDAVARAAVERRGRPRPLAWGLAAVGAATCVAAMAAWLVPTSRRAPAPAGLSADAPTAPASVAPASATPLLDGTDLAPDPEGEGRSFVLRAGKARFVVPHDPLHPFRVRAGPIVVEDLGTMFTVGIAADGTVAVDVQEGSVRVRGEGDAIEVLAGQRRDFPSEARAAAVSTPEVPGAVPAPRLTNLPHWQALAESGRFDDAYQALLVAGPSAVHDDTTELLAAADAARLSGHPAEAAAYLRRVLRAHGRDPRAALAAYTLGRELLDELGRPAEAVDAFERARADGGVMAEEALAREVEACSRAGDAPRARDLAAEYMRRYPGGRRARAVAKFGGTL